MSPMEQFAADIREIIRLERLWRDPRNLEEARKRRSFLLAKLVGEYGLREWSQVREILNEAEC